MNPIIFEIQNLIPISFILILTIITLYKNYKSKKYYKFWSPLTFISLIYIYYTIIGAIILLSAEDLEYLGTNLSKTATYGWVGASISLFSIHLGFLSYKGSSKLFHNLNLNSKKAFKIGVLLFLIGFFVYSLFRGFNLNIVQSSSKLVFQDGGFSQYFINCLSFLILACMLLIPSIVKSRFKVYYYLPIILTIIVFIIGGFRYRLVYLVIAMATMYYLYTKKRIKIWFWIAFTFCFVIFMGVMEMSREYAQGLNLSKTNGLGVKDFTLSAFNETNTFLVTGRVIKNTYDSGNYVYGEPLITALFMPIPRSIFPNKPDGGYLKKIQVDIFGTSENGAAFLNYAEAFLAFGWIGIIIQGILIGFLAKLFWVNYLRNPEKITQIASLALFNGFTYIMISRGYFSAHLTLFFYYIIIPFWLIKNIYKKF